MLCGQRSWRGGQATVPGGTMGAAEAAGEEEEAFCEQAQGPWASPSSVTQHAALLACFGCLHSLMACWCLLACLRACRWFVESIIYVATTASDSR